MLDVLRVEKKYKIPIYLCERVKNKLSYYMKKDLHCSDSGYEIRTLYFDTLYNDDFYDKVDGLNYKKKIRLRRYIGSNEFVKLELKEKEGQFQRKRSLKISIEDAKEMINMNYDFLLEHGEFGHKLYTILIKGVYRPVCMVEYKRYAFILETNDTRITFDTELRSSESNFDLFDDNVQLYPVHISGHCIMEVKYNHFLMSYLKDVISIVDGLSTANSKYCQSRKYGLKGEYV